jgi:hypothetical protein
VTRENKGRSWRHKEEKQSELAFLYQNRPGELKSCVTSAVRPREDTTCIARRVNRIVSNEAPINISKATFHTASKVAKRSEPPWR